MTLKNGEKPEEELTRPFKIDIRNLTNFDARTVFWPYYIMFELQKYRGVMFDCTQDWY